MQACVDVILLQDAKIGSLAAWKYCCVPCVASEQSDVGHGSSYKRKVVIKAVIAVGVAQLVGGLEKRAMLLAILPLALPLEVRKCLFIALCGACERALLGVLTWKDMK
eukprot:219518-Chlamydomonas_euryale.AAC.2